MELLERHFDIALKSPDGIKKIRELILSLAMQGKLVPQDAKDQPASELLKEIEAEKKKLIKEGKIKKQDPLPPIKPEEIPCEVPAGWEWVRLIDVLEIHNGRAYKANELLDSGIPVLRVGNLFTSNHWYYSDLLLEENKYIAKGDLIFAWSASFGPFIWKSSKVIYHYHIWKLSLHKEDETLKYYLYNFLLEKTIEIQASGHGIAMKHMTKERMEKLFTPLPPLAEQKRIIAKIDQLMALCDKLEAERDARNKKRVTLHTAVMDRLLSAPDQVAFSASWEFITRNFSDLYSVPKNVAELKKAILQLAVMGKLVPQDPNDQPASELLKEIEAEKKRLIKEGKIKKQEPLPPIKLEEIPYEVPTGWEWVRLNNILDVRDGTHDTPKYVNEGVPLITSKNFKNGTIDFNDAKLISPEDHLLIRQRSLVERDDILFSMIGGNIGNMVMVNTDIEFSIKNVALFKYYDKTLIFPYFIMLFLKNLSFFIQDKAVGGAQPFVSLSLLRNQTIPLPPLAEQKRIVAKVDQLMELCNSLEQQLQYSTRKQTAILDAVLATM